MDGRSEDRTKAILEEMSAADQRIRVLDNPQQRTTFGLNIGLAERPRRLRRADGRAHRVSARVRRQGHRAPAARRRGGVGHRPPDPARHRPVVAARRDRADARGSAPGGSAKWEAEEEKDIDTGVFTGVWKRSTLDEYGGWDDGWPVNQDSELAARFFERGSPHRLHARAGRAVRAARLAEEARQAVLALRLLPREDEPLPPERACAARPSSRPRSCWPLPAAVIAPRPIRLAARAALGAWAAAVLATSAPRRAASTPRAMPPACPPCSPRCTSPGGSASCAAAWPSGRRWRRWRGSPACAADRTGRIARAARRLHRLPLLARGRRPTTPSAPSSPSSPACAR